jgi:hypothetical protein
MTVGDPHIRYRLLGRLVRAFLMMSVAWQIAKEHWICAGFLLVTAASTTVGVWLLWQEIRAHLRGNVEEKDG